MDDAFLIARRYLAPRGETFWWWSTSGANATATGGDAITWTNGNTIAFYEEFAHVIKRLAPGGLPPADAVVMLLAACRDNWDGRFAAQWTEWARLEPRSLPDWLSEVLQGLDRVHALAAAQRHSLEAKALLADVIFEDAPHRGRAFDARVIVDALECQPPPELIEQQYDESWTFDRLFEALRSLKPGLDRLTPEGLRLRERTGLEQVVEAAANELWPSDQMRMLLGELMQDDELSGLARLARSLMAAIHLPRPLADPDDIPAGGVSDISNRGNLDRLLISELAHDDLTLAVRVATNEALYLRRETPPKQPPRRRAVFIDTGIRMWGVPRVFATAVAMALTAKSDRGAEVDVYRADGDGITRGDLTTRDGLVEHLEALSAAPHPGNGVRQFLERVNAAPAAADAVVVTCEEVLADREFRASVAASAAVPHFVATVARNGQFILHARSAIGSRQVAEAKLDLEELLAPPKRPILGLLDRQIDPALPLILGRRPLPLLLPHHLDVDRAWHVEQHGAFAITGDRRLMHWPTPGQGARELAHDMPTGTLLWCQSKSFAERTYAVIASPGNSGLHQIEVDLTTCESHSHPLEISEPVRAVCSRQGMLFVIGKRTIEVFSLPTRLHCESQTIPAHTSWVHDRFFRGPGGWYALSHDGVNTRFELVVGSTDRRVHDLVTMFDVAGVQGPVGLQTNGDLWFSADGTVKRPQHGLKPGVRSLAVARNGQWLVAWGSPAIHSGGYGDGNRQLIDVLRGTAQAVSGELRPAVEPELRSFIAPRTLRVRFRGIYADGNALVLISKNGTHLRFRNAYTSRHALDLVPTQAKPIEFVAFESVARPQGASYSLRVAQWRDGSRAFLDSRGLLHLKSSSSSVADATLVLYEGPTACWTSDGRMCGPDYFTGGKANTNVESVFNEVICRFASLLP